eukprot:6191493-Amphidinium_carterae.1
MLTTLTRKEGQIRTPERRVDATHPPYAMLWKCSSIGHQLLQRLAHWGISGGIMWTWLRLTHVTGWRPSRRAQRADLGSEGALPRRAPACGEVAHFCQYACELHVEGNACAFPACL